MSITPSAFKIRFPEFIGIADARVQFFIDDSVVLLNESWWGEKYNLGLYYLTAHYLSLGKKTEDGDSEATSAISSQSVDGTSISFAIPSASDQAEAFYLSSAYGQRYLALRKTLGVAAYVV